MRALVTGAAGLIGSNLAWELAARGFDVVALDNFSTGIFENLAGFPGDVIAADVCDTAYWGPRVGRVDVVFHQAAITDTTVTDQRLMLRVNVEAFRDLLGWATQAKVKKIVYASSAGVYGDSPVPMREDAPPKPLNVYAFSKAIMENVAARAAQAKNAPKIVGLRYFNVFGPRETHKAKAASMIWQLALQMKAGHRPRIFEFGEQYRDFIYVKDVVEANIKAFEKAPTGVYNVCTGAKTDFNSMIASLNKTLSLKLEPDYIKNPYSFYQNETLGSPAKAAQAFGFKARFSVAQGIEDYLGSGRVRRGAAKV